MDPAATKRVDRNASEYQLDYFHMQRGGSKTHPETPQRLTNST